MKHELKTWPVAFELALSGSKMFEIRVNDRDFQIGDTLHLREYELETGHYTGRELWRKVTCVVTGWGLPDGTCALGLEVADDYMTERDKKYFRMGYDSGYDVALKRATAGRL